MQVKRTNQSETVVSLAIVADAAELAAIKDTVINRLSTRVKLAGFRPGKAPKELVEKNLDQQVLQTEFLDETVNKLVQDALDQEKLRIVTQPKVSLTKFVPFSTVEFTAELEVLAPVKLPDYKKIKKSKPVVAVTAKDVEEVIASLGERMSERKAVERAAKKGDEAVIDFFGTDAKGKAVAGAEGKAYPLILGSNSFIPGFEDNVIGMKPGVEKSFTVTFPKDYGVKALANQKVTFAVTIQTLNEMVKPAVDDDFAAKVGPFKTVEAMKADIKKQLQTEKEYQRDRKFENDLIDEIAGKSKVALPESLIHAQIEKAEEEERRNLMYKGQTWQEHLEAEGMTEEEHRDKKIRPVAESQLKAGLTIAQIAIEEDVQVTRDELETRLQQLKAQYPDPKMQEELDKPENRREIANRMVSEKAIAKAVEIVTSGK